MDGAEQNCRLIPLTNPFIKNIRYKKSAVKIYRTFVVILIN
ncbi:hypothetical protein BV121_768 [Haemophilus influenzae]|nr:hypothetical protein BV121_768 [Haemophilus influenzae]AVJ01229.1 hypothetical protein BV122_772 [Haemophilus influenzae]